MYHKLLQNHNFHTLLKAIDEQLLAEARQNPCSCGGTLHQAHYQRSPLGLSALQREYYTKRYALCCGKCRKRTPIPTVRFFGRQRFISAIFVLVSCLKRGITARAINQIHRHFGFRISKRTWKRWRYWWDVIFMHSSFCKAKCSMPIDVTIKYPRCLFQFYKGSEKLVKILQFLAPMTAGIYRAV